MNEKECGRLERCPLKDLEDVMAADADSSIQSLSCDDDGQTFLELIPISITR